MITKKIKQKPTQIRISEYQEVFSIISVLSKKYVYPNMPKKYRFWYLYENIEIGTMYKRGDKFSQVLYFSPKSSYLLSGDTTNGYEFHNLEDILDYLDTPTQILKNFWLKLFKFSKERKKKIQGLRGALQFLTIILENEEECRT
jgi:hypothetical protein